MTKKAILIGLVVLASLIGLYFIFRKSKDDCPPARNPDKFPEGWLDDKIPHGDLNRLAGKYVTPLVGGNDQENGSIIGGFFKGIDVYPSDGAAKHYGKWLKEYLDGEDALPHWNIEQGEFLCQN